MTWLATRGRVMVSQGRSCWKRTTETQVSDKVDILEDKAGTPND